MKSLRRFSFCLLNRTAAGGPLSITEAPNQRAKSRRTGLKIFVWILLFIIDGITLNRPLFVPHGEIVVHQENQSKCTLSGLTGK